MGRKKGSSDAGLLSVQISAQLKEALAKPGAPSQNAVAESTGIAKGQLSDMLAGKKQFTVGQLDAVCYVLRLDMVKLIEVAEAATDTRHLETTMTVLVDGS